MYIPDIFTNKSHFYINSLWTSITQLEYLKWPPDRIAGVQPDRFGFYEHPAGSAPLGSDLLFIFFVYAIHIDLDILG